MAQENGSFSKKSQIKKGKKEKLGPTRKEERRQARATQFESHDKDVYAEVIERSYDPIENYYRCEYCKQRPAEELHHVIHRSQGGRTTPDNVVHLCKRCHDELGHAIKWGTILCKRRHTWPEH